MATGGIRGMSESGGGGDCGFGASSDSCSPVPGSLALSSAGSFWPRRLRFLGGCASGSTSFLARPRFLGAAGTSSVPAASASAPAAGAFFRPPVLGAGAGAASSPSAAAAGGFFGGRPFFFGGAGASGSALEARSASAVGPGIALSSAGSK